MRRLNKFERTDPMVSWLVVILWSSLTVAFFVRFRNVMINLGHAIKPGTGLLRVPKISFRPIRQLTVWAVELALLVLFYDIFGMAVVAHVTAAVTCCAVMFMLRDKHAASWLHAVQLVPDSSPPSSWGFGRIKEAANGRAAH
jgi:hypothetical protein